MVVTASRTSCEEGLMTSTGSSSTSSPRSLEGILGLVLHSFCVSTSDLYLNPTLHFKQTLKIVKRMAKRMIIEPSMTSNIRFGCLCKPFLIPYRGIIRFDLGLAGNEVGGPRILFLSAGYSFPTYSLRQVSLYVY